jgi:hypothetical protein
MVASRISVKGESSLDLLIIGELLGNPPMEMSIQRREVE